MSEKELREHVQAIVEGYFQDEDEHGCSSAPCEYCRAIYALEVLIDNLGLTR